MIFDLILDIFGQKSLKFIPKMANKVDGNLGFNSPFKRELWIRNALKFASTQDFAGFFSKQKTLAYAIK